MSRFSTYMASVLRRSIHSLPNTLSPIPDGLGQQHNGRARSTAWLDGLRGVSACLIFLFHFAYAHNNVLKYGYGGNNGNNDKWITLLPLFRILIDGRAHVNIFWVVSGIALSLKPIQLARNKEWEKSMACVASFTFRRAIRLYLPCLAVTFSIMIAIRLGLYDHADYIHHHWPFTAVREMQPPVLPTFWAQFQHWVSQVWGWANPMDHGKLLYNHHLWTIPLEFKGSIVLFATLVAQARLQPKMRVVCGILCYLYWTILRYDYLAPFYGGMLCAEYMLVLQERKKLLPSNKDSSGSKDGLGLSCLWVVLFIFSMVLLGFPSGDKSPSFGHATLAKLIPLGIGPIWWQVNGATMLAFVVARGEFLQRLFDNRISVYLGKISFGMYIVHGAFNHVMGYRLVPFMWSIFGKQTLFQYELGVGLAWMVEAVFVFWTAAVVDRNIIQPSARFSAWLENRWKA